MFALDAMRNVHCQHVYMCFDYNYNYVMGFSLGLSLGPFFQSCDHVKACGKRTRKEVRVDDCMLYYL